METNSSKAAAVLNLVGELLPVVVGLISEARKLAEGAGTRPVAEILDEADRNALGIIERAKAELAKLEATDGNNSKTDPNG